LPWDFNESLMQELATGTFVADQRNVVLVGGTGAGKSHLPIAIARALIRNGARGRFFNVIDLVNRLKISVLLLGQRAQERDVVGGLPWGQKMLSPWQMSFTEPMNIERDRSEQ
jgi:hypothetical protein